MVYTLVSYVCEWYAYRAYTNFEVPACILAPLYTWTLGTLGHCSTQSIDAHKTYIFEKQCIIEKKKENLKYWTELIQGENTMLQLA